MKTVIPAGIVANTHLWAEEAQRRDAAWDETTARPATEVLRDARNRLK